MIPDDGKGFFVGQILFCISYYLQALKIKLNKTVIVIEQAYLIKFVKILQMFLSQSDRTESHLIGNTLVRIEPDFVKLGTENSEPIKLNLLDIKTFFRRVEFHAEWILQDLPHESFIFLNNFILLMSKTKVSISDIIRTMKNYDEFSASIIEIGLETSELGRDELLKIEAFDLIRCNYQRTIFLIFCCQITHS